ncbi:MULTISPECIES: hypothetical protein [Streptococcus]|uniref:hypothetical protein n=1 Tax=Streptococcus TaxID=1301 RepID=UPI0013D96A7B|nr:hypothetical protein [Streptococcus canis]QKG74676.1 hypothetical protein GE023_010540 [Streptococcus canis]
MDVFTKIIEQDINNIPDSSPYKNAMIEGLKAIKLFESEKVEKNRVKNILSLRLMTEEYESGQIGLKPFTNTLNSLETIQENGIAAMLGYEGKRGKIPKDILERNELIITATRAGSFIVDFGVKENQLSLFEEENVVNNYIVTDVTGLLQENINVSEFVEKYSPRTFTAVKTLISNLNKEKIGFEIRDEVKDILYSFPKEKVKEINSKLRDTYIENHEGVEISGKLVKADLKSQKITLDSGNEQITIKIKDDNIKELHLTTNEKYKIITNVKEIIKGIQRTKNYSAHSIKNITKL